MRPNLWVIESVLGRLPGLKINHLEPLLPGNWKPPTTNSR